MQVGPYTRSHVTLLSCGQKVPVRGSVWLPLEGSSWSRLLSREAGGRGRPVIAAVNECASECGPGDGGFNGTLIFWPRCLRGLRMLVSIIPRVSRGMKKRGNAAKEGAGIGCKPLEPSRCELLKVPQQLLCCVKPWRSLLNICSPPKAPSARNPVHACWCVHVCACKYSQQLAVLSHLSNASI